MEDAVRCGAVQLDLVDGISRVWRGFVCVCVCLCVNVTTASIIAVYSQLFYVCDCCFYCYFYCCCFLKKPTTTFTFVSIVIHIIVFILLSVPFLLPFLLLFPLFLLLLPLLLFPSSFEAGVFSSPSFFLPSLNPPYYLYV